MNKQNKKVMASLSGECSAFPLDMRLEWKESCTRLTKGNEEALVSMTETSLSCRTVKVVDRRE